MQSVRQIQRLNDAELKNCVPPNASWHTDYRDTAYIHVGGLPFELSEGDVLTIFSQYGNPVHISLIRDKETGKSRGFAFVKYEDQRSCDLAVDNLSGAGVLGRVLTVDHARYKLKDGEIEGEGMNEADDTDEDATDAEGDQRRKRRRSGSLDGGDRPMIKEEQELAKLLREHDDDDPMKAYLVKEKKEQVAEALKNLSVKDESRRRRRDHHRSDKNGHGDSRRHSRERRRRPDRESRDAQDTRARSRETHQSERRHKDRVNGSVKVATGDDRESVHRHRHRRSSSSDGSHTRHQRR